MKKLLSPLKMRNTTFRNRIVISPMCQYSSTEGFASDWHLVHLGSRAVGGAALVVQEATAVTPEGRITYGDMGLYTDAHEEKLSQIVAFIQAQGALAGIQLAHAGRKASCKKPWDGGGQIPSGEENGWQTISASDNSFKEGEEDPVAMSIEGIKDLVAAFVEATRRSEKIGYDVVEIHAAHGYLLHQFYSPLSNHRTDEYGGSFDKRVRLLLEITEGVRAAWPAEKPLFVRISASDWTEGGWTIEDSVRLSVLLKERGVDLVDASSGGNVPKANIPSAPGYQVTFAAQIKKEGGLYTAAVGRITTPEQAEEILQEDKADLIFIARESLRNAYFPLYAAFQLEEKIEWPLQYERGQLKEGQW